MIVGYARVSSYDQSLDVQLDLLEQAGCEKIFSEKVSGAKHDRPEFSQMLSFIRDGDSLVVTKLDRMARSMLHFWQTYEKLNEKGVTLRILNMAVDTSTSHGKLVLGVLSSVAEFEREMILERQREGIEKAKEKGKRFGRPPLSDDIKEAVIRFSQEGVSKVEIQRRLNIGSSSVYKILREQA